MAFETEPLSNAKVLDIACIRSCSSDSDILGAAIITTHSSLGIGNHWQVDVMHTGHHALWSCE